jgi:hypothetical protein
MICLSFVSWRIKKPAALTGTPKSVTWHYLELLPSMSQSCNTMYIFTSVFRVNRFPTGFPSRYTKDYIRLSVSVDLQTTVTSLISLTYKVTMLIPVAARSKAWVLRPLACWDCGFEFRRGHGCLFLVSFVCCQVEVCASGWSLVQRSPFECGVSECDHESTIMRRHWPTGAVASW